MLILTRVGVRAAVTMRDAVDAAREAFVALAAGEGDVPPRTPIRTSGGTALFMPAYERRSETLGLKLVSVNAENAARGLPTVQAVVVLVEGTTGTAVALIEGT